MTCKRCLIGVLAVLIAAFLPIVTLAFGASDDKATPTASAKVYAARVLADIQLGNLGQGAWCYEIEPSFIVRSGQTLKRFDIKGSASTVLKLPEFIGSATCSRDGRVISLLSRPNVGEPKLRLSIFDTRSKEMAEYLVSPPTTSGPNFDPLDHPLMSPDGSIFALPANPVIVSGPDVLRDKKIVHASGNVFWTNNFVFIGESARNRYQVKRIPSLDDLGPLEFPQDRVIKNIVECQGRHYVHYFVDELQQEILEPIVDKRLGGTAGAVIKDVGSVSQSGERCTIVRTREAGGAQKITGVDVIGQTSERSVSLSRFDRLGSSMPISKDGRLVLGSQVLGPLGSPTRRARIIVLEIER